MVVSTVGLPVDSMEYLTPMDLARLVDLQVQKEKMDWELLARAVSVGYANTQGKKTFKVFPDEQNQKKRVDKITPDERAELLDHLKEV